jgi:hypothetical protein
MLKIYNAGPDKYSSQLVEDPLDRLNLLASKSERGDPVVERELEVAMELIGEVFHVGGEEVRRMIKERMARKGQVAKAEGKRPP